MGKEACYIGGNSRNSAIKNVRIKSTMLSTFFDDNGIHKVDFLKIDTVSYIDCP